MPLWLLTLAVISTFLLQFHPKHRPHPSLILKDITQTLTLPQGYTAFIPGVHWLSDMLLNTLADGGNS